MRKNNKNEVDKKIIYNNKMTDSFNNAINGVVASINTERNMLVHMITAIAVIVLSFFLNFTRVELLIIILTVVFVLVSELFNTSIEVLTDLVTDKKYNILAKKVKDIAAGAVLLSAIASVCVGYLLIYPKVKDIFFSHSIVRKVMTNMEHLAFLSISLVLLLTLLLKGIFYKKNSTYLFGGSISGHTALAFNLATIGSIMAQNYVIGFILFLLAFLVMESRYEAKIHTIREVIFGAILGIVVGLLFFMSFII